MVILITTSHIMFVFSEMGEEQGGREWGAENSRYTTKSSDGKLLLERDFRGITCTRSFLHRGWCGVLGQPHANRKDSFKLIFKGQCFCHVESWASL